MAVASNFCLSSSRLEPSFSQPEPHQSTYVPYNLRPSSVRNHFVITFIVRTEHRYTSSISSNPDWVHQEIKILKVQVSRFQVGDSFRWSLRETLHQLLFKFAERHYNQLDRILNQILEYASSIQSQESNVGRSSLGFCAQIDEIKYFVCQEQVSSSTHFMALIEDFRNGGGGSFDGVSEIEKPWMKNVLKDAKIEEDCEINCSICLEDVQVGKIATSIPCTHMFHRPCIVKWLCKNQSCPLCRTKLTLEVICCPFVAPALLVKAGNNVYMVLRQTSLTSFGFM
ncbi:Zinc finger, RING-type [Dillenia turbinata]|uniref:Zinc finger, RING-type n=1 Tax=Dillenia turbinata TaxID=194707 RepID=A0AAN8YSU9_9MAGN